MAGRKYTSKVEDTKALAQVKVGDKVDIVWTEALLVSIDRGRPTASWTPPNREAWDALRHPAPRDRQPAGFPGRPRCTGVYFARRIDILTEERS